MLNTKLSTVGLTKDYIEASLFNVDETSLILLTHDVCNQFPGLQTEDLREGLGRFKKDKCNILHKYLINHLMHHIEDSTSIFIEPLKASESERSILVDVKGLKHEITFPIKMINKYFFPKSDSYNRNLEVIRKNDDEILIEKLMDCKNKGNARTSLAKGTDYIKWREGYAAISIGLNEKDLIAPAFRHFHIWAPFDVSSSEDKKYRLDCQIIDLHYLYHNHKEILSPKTRDLKKLFRNSKFDLVLAEKYVKRPEGMNEKVAEIGMPECIQYELFIYKTLTVRKRVKTVRAQSKDIEKKLRDHAMQPRSRLKLQDVNNRVDEFICLKLANGAPVTAANYYIKMQGGHAKTLKVLAETFRKRRNWYEKTLGIIKW